MNLDLAPPPKLISEEDVAGRLEEGKKSKLEEVSGDDRMSMGILFGAVPLTPPLPSLLVTSEMTRIMLIF